MNEDTKKRKKRSWKIPKDWITQRGTGYPNRIRPITTKELRDFIDELLQQQQEKFLKMVGEDEETILRHETNGAIGEDLDAIGRNQLRQELREKLCKTDSQK